MTDVFSRTTRSSIMSAVKSCGNESTELKLIKIFKQSKILGWRRNWPLAGKPDFVFPKSKIAVFVDGCFWHGHDCRNTKPQANKSYWVAKIRRNKTRDRLVTRKLRREGWSVVRLWECAIAQNRINSLFKTFYPKGRMA
ncbi:MAG: very short patch repair endonuclease [Elusimicrobia bacterium]|nr:very short patch repair endonuclease [Elusimicrobiota bacterium]